MEPPLRRSPINPVLLVGLLVLGSTAFLTSCSTVEDAEAPASRAAPIFDRFVIEGVSHTAYEGSRKIFTFEAEEMIHRKRKVGPLTINPVKEMEVTGVKLAVYRDSSASASQAEKEESSIPLKDFIEKVGSSTNLGLVSRVLINDLEITLYRGGTLEYTLAAGRATAGSGDREIDFEDGFRLTSSAGQELNARRARWSNDRNRLLVSGDYSLRDGAEVTKGSAAEFILGPEARILILEEATGRR